MEPSRGCAAVRAELCEPPVESAWITPGCGVGIEGIDVLVRVAVIVRVVGARPKVRAWCGHHRSRKQEP